MTVARRLRDEFARTAVDLAVEHHRRLCRIPVVRIVRRRLEIPDHLPGVGVERHDRRGEEIVAGPVLVRDHRLRIAGRDEDQVQLGIVGDRLPRHAAAVPRHLLVRPRFRPRIAFLLRDDVPPPLQLAGFRIARVEIAGDVEVVAADADDDVILDDHRRDRPVIELIQIGDRLVPALGAVLDVQADEIVVGRFEIQPVAQDGDAAIGEMIAARRLPEVVPDLAARPRIDRPRVIRRGEVEHAVDLQRRRLDRCLNCR